MSLCYWFPLTTDLCNLGTKSLIQASVQSGVSKVDNGKLGSCYKNTGTAANVAIPITFNASSFTLCAWVRVDTRRNNWCRSFGLAGSGTYMGLGCEHTNGTSIGFHYYKTINGSNTSIFDLYPFNSENGTWVHYAMAYDGAKYYIYKNGILTNSAAANKINIPAEMTTLYLFGGTSGNYSLHSLNDVRIYDHCLSAAEVHEIALGLVLHYKLDGNSLPLNKNIVGAARYNVTTNSGWGAHRGTTTNVSIDTSAPVPWHQGTLLVVTYNTSWGSGGGCGFTCGQFNTSGNTTYCYSLYIQAPDDMASLSANWLYRYEYNSSGTQQIELGVAATSRAQSLGNHWYRVWGTFTTQANTTRTSFYFFTYPNKTITYYFCCPQVELGTTLSPWNDGSSGGIITDSSGYGHHSTLNGSASISSDTARYSSSIHFGAYNTPYTTLNDTSFLPALTNCTITYWCKHDNTSNSLSFTGLSTSQYVMATNSSSNYYHGNAGSITVYRDGTAGSYKSIANEWHFLALTGVNLSGWTQFKINSYNSSWPLNAYISDVRIYATLLSATDIQALYNVGAKVDNKGSFHTYEFNENGSNKLKKTGVFYDYAVEPYLILSDGSLWQMLLFHYVNNGTNQFTSSNASYNNGFGLYSRLRDIDNFKYNNKYEFLAIQDDVLHRWTLTSAPLTTTSVAGFTKVSGSPTGGLCKCSGNTLLAISNSTGNWWNACGCWTNFNNGLPGFNGTTVKRYLALYARIDKIDNHIASGSIYSNNLIEL